MPTQFLPSEIVAMMGSEIGNSDTTISGAETLAASLSDSFRQEGETAMELEALLTFTNQEAPLVVDSDDRTLKQQVDGFEKALILKALSDSQSNISSAARLLGVKRTTLIEKMTRMEITRSQ